jgi:hypothetical protein
VSHVPATELWLRVQGEDAMRPEHSQFLGSIIPNTSNLGATAPTSATVGVNNEAALYSDGLYSDKQPPPHTNNNNGNVNNNASRSQQLLAALRIARAENYLVPLLDFGCTSPQDVLQLAPDQLFALGIIGFVRVTFAT